MNPPWSPASGFGVDFDAMRGLIREMREIADHVDELGKQGQTRLTETEAGHPTAYAAIHQFWDSAKEYTKAVAQNLETEADAVYKASGIYRQADSSAARAYADVAKRDESRSPAAAAPSVGARNQEEPGRPADEPTAAPRSAVPVFPLPGGGALIDPLNPIGPGTPPDLARRAARTVASAAPNGYTAKLEIAAGGGIVGATLGYDPNTRVLSVGGKLYEGVGLGFGVGAIANPNPLEPGARFGISGLVGAYLGPLSANASGGVGSSLTDPKAPVGAGAAFTVTGPLSEGTVICPVGGSCFAQGGVNNGGTSLAGLGAFAGVGPELRVNISVRWVGDAAEFVGRHLGVTSPPQDPQTSVPTPDRTQP